MDYVICKKRRQILILLKANLKEYRKPFSYGGDRIKTKKTLIYTIFIYVSISIIAIMFLMPIVITIINSFMTEFEITNRYTDVFTLFNRLTRREGTSDTHFVNMSLIPNYATIRQYFELLFRNPDYLGKYLNSIKIAVPIVIGQVLVSVSAAYVFEMSKNKYKEYLFIVYIIVMFMPLQVVLVPHYMVASFFNIKESVLAIILPAIFNPFGVYLIRQFMKSIPYEYIEAAKIDGAGHLRILSSIIVPLVKPAIAALSILVFIDSWNIVEQAIIFIKEAFNEPLSINLSQMSKTQLGIIFSASSFYMLPPLLILLYGQDEFIEGMQLSGIK